MGRPLRIAVQGCCHGELNAVYASIRTAEELHGYKVDLLIIGGDFQSIRNLADLSCMAVPAKFRKLGNFADYYAGLKVAPVLTIFVGGNHEASNYLQELFYGGWVAPNIYYLGAANVVTFGGLRIGGISGIWSKSDYIRGHFEKIPYDQKQLRSVYHVRQFEVKKLLALTRSKKIDMFLSHDWPRGIEQHGDTSRLLRAKPFFREEVMRNDLGSPANEDLLNELKPRYWFCAHLHVKFEALVRHAMSSSKKRPRESRSLSPNLKPESTGPAQKDPNEISIDLEDEDHAEQALVDPNEIQIDLEDESVIGPELRSSDIVSVVDFTETSNGVIAIEPPQVKKIDNRPTQQITSSEVTDGAAPEATETNSTLTLEEYKAQVLARNGLDDQKPSGIALAAEMADLVNATQFLALDKCLPRRQFLEIMTISSTEGTDDNEDARDNLSLRYDEEWLAITKTYAEYLSTTSYQKRLPDRTILDQSFLENRKWVASHIDDLKVPINFVETAPIQSPQITERSRCKLKYVYRVTITDLVAKVYRNPQTETFCGMLQIKEPFI